MHMACDQVSTSMCRNVCMLVCFCDQAPPPFPRTHARTHTHTHTHTHTLTHSLTHTHTHTHRRNVSFHAPAGIFTSAETFGANGKPATREFSAWTSSTTLTSGGGRSWAKRCVSASLRTLLELPVCRPTRIRVSGTVPADRQRGRVCSRRAGSRRAFSRRAYIIPERYPQARRWHVQS